MDYARFKKKWIGKYVDYDGIYGRQCVDLIKQYAHEVYGLKAGAWGDAIDYWYNTNKDLYKKFDRVSTTKARQGDIVIFKGVNGNAYGHIGVCDRHVGSLWIVVPTLEQNGSTGNGSGVGDDAIRVRNIPRWRVVGVLRPKVAKPVLKMPAVGSTITLNSVSRTTFKAGTTRRAGVIRNPKNWVYTVRGYDSRYPNRVIINSRSGGGDGVALALFYTNGKRIEGWR